MADLNPEIEKAHKFFAPTLFNRVWELMELPERTADETDEMIHTAHASRYHWTVIGEPVNLVRGDWQVSRMYTVAGRYAEALYWAERCVARCEAERIGDFDLAYAYEAMVRALALLGRVEDARSWFAKMQTAALDIVKDGDREWFEKDVASLRQLI